jgi:hypothetical protein
VWRARALLMAVGRWVLAVGWLKLAVTILLEIVGSAVGCRKILVVFKSETTLSVIRISWITSDQDMYYSMALNAFSFHVVAALVSILSLVLVFGNLLLLSSLTLLQFTLIKPKYYTLYLTILYKLKTKMALRGVKVLDFSRVLAGPFCTMVCLRHMQNFYQHCKWI